MSLFARVQVQARSENPVVLLLTVLAAPFYATGWVVGRTARGALFLIGWAWAAVKVGFTDGRKS